MEKQKGVHNNSVSNVHFNMFVRRVRSLTPRPRPGGPLAEPGGIDGGCVERENKKVVHNNSVSNVPFNVFVRRVRSLTPRPRPGGIIDGGFVDGGFIDGGCVER